MKVASVRKWYAFAQYLTDEEIRALYADCAELADWELVPADEGTAAQEEFLRSARRSFGQLLRGPLERGCSGEVLAASLRVVRRLRQHARRAVESWPAPAVYRVVPRGARPG